MRAEEPKLSVIEFPHSSCLEPPPDHDTRVNRKPKLLMTSRLRGRGYPPDPWGSNRGFWHVKDRADGWTIGATATEIGRAHV